MKERFMTKYLIFNSDDFGISDGINRGVIEAHQNGIVSSTCTMSNMPSAEAGIQLAQSSAPKLGVGLHLTLSFGMPVSPPESVPSLVVEDGQFAQNYQQLMKKLPVYTDEDLQTELQAQFDHFVKLAGCLPSHIDSHHRAAYVHPASFEVMCRLCAEHDLPMRRPTWLDNAQGYEGMPTNADGTLVEQLRVIYEKYDSPRCPENIVDTFHWERGSRVELFKTVVSNIGDGVTEIVCHVGYAEGLNEDYTFQREDELEAITHADLIELVKSNDIRLITFADLP
jgi:chitin disaccharide deacetylase